MPQSHCLWSIPSKRNDVQNKIQFYHQNDRGLYWFSVTEYLLIYLVWTHNFIVLICDRCALLRNILKKNGLTNNHSVWAVPLWVLLTPSHTAGTGLCLVRAQGLPLTLQTVLVLQVVLHVWLQENRHHFSHRFKQHTRASQKSAESKYGC